MGKARVTAGRDSGLPLERNSPFHIVDSFRGALRGTRDLIASSLAPAVLNSKWRGRRLLILGYHGTSLDDEHLWDGCVYMSPEFLRRRLTILKNEKCVVLPLKAALTQLYSGTLSPRSVALVFDDGFHDFYSVTAPILAEFGYSATVYWATYYAGLNRPVFDVMLRYLLWKAGTRNFKLPDILPEPLLLDDSSRELIKDRIRNHIFENRLSGREKDGVLGKLAAALDIDYEDICRRRLLHVMSNSEAAKMHAEGHDLQLHTHRHRVSRNRALFDREIRDNREWIERASGATPSHFCYPGGVYEPAFPQWLREWGIESAVTCQLGLASANTDRMLLPRLIDNSFMSERAFRAWIAGAMEFFPRGVSEAPLDQMMDEAHSQFHTPPRVSVAQAGR